MIFVGQVPLIDGFLSFGYHRFYYATNHLPFFEFNLSNHEVFLLLDWANRGPFTAK